MPYLSIANKRNGRRSGAITSLLALLLAVFCSPTARASHQFQTTSDTLLGGTLTLPASGTVSFAVNPQFAQSDANYHILFEVHANAAPGASFTIMKHADGTLVATWYNSSGGEQLAARASTYSLPQNTWSFISATWVSGGATSLYLNGSLIASASGPGWYDTTGETMSIGNRYSAGYDAQGQMALVGVWSRVLASAEISTLGLGAVPSTIGSGLIAEYDLAGASLAPQAGTYGTLRASSTISAGDPPPYFAPVPRLTLSGPSNGITGPSGWASPSFVVTGYNLAATTSITPSDGAGGSFSPASVAVTAAIPRAIFQYTPTSSGTKNVSISNNQSIANPAPVTYNAVALTTISANTNSQSVTHGTDVTYTLTVSGTASARLMMMFVPPGSTYSIAGTTCAVAGSSKSFAASADCGTIIPGTYVLTIHTATITAGTYLFTVSAAVPQAANASSVTLSLTVT